MKIILYRTPSPCRTPVVFIFLGCSWYYLITFTVPGVIESTENPVLDLYRIPRNANEQPRSAGTQLTAVKEKKVDRLFYVLLIKQQSKTERSIAFSSFQFRSVPFVGGNNGRVFSFWCGCCDFSFR